MRKRLVVGMCLIIGLWSSAVFAALPKEPNSLDDCDVVWDTPGNNSTESMPLGNGDIGLNLWVVEDGDLCFYLGKTDAWDSKGQLLKLGCLRLKVTPNPFRKGAPFRQHLRLSTATAEVTAGSPGEEVHIRLWVDANAPVINLELTAKQPVDWEVSMETPWRTGDVYRDGEMNRIVWYQRNATSNWSDALRQQGLADFMASSQDPLLNRTFGGMVKGAGLVSAGPARLVAAHTAKASCALYLLTAQTKTPEAWLAQLEQIVARAEARDPRQARVAHETWWRNFWARSWLRIETSKVLPSAPGDVRYPLATNHIPLRFGADPNGQNLFDGDLALVRLYHRAIPAAEAATLAASGGARLAGERACVGEWRFADTRNGVTPNSAGDGLACQVVGDTELVDAPAGLQKAIRLKGGYLEVADDPRLDSTGHQSWEAWLRPRVLTTGRLIDKYPFATGSGLLIDLYPGNALRMLTPGHGLAYDAKLTPGVWYHLLLTYDAHRGRTVFYLDGKAVATVQSGGNIETEDEGLRVSRQYARQRFLNACGGRGAYPIKFNGSIFTFERVPFGVGVDRDDSIGGRKYDPKVPDPDFRLYGGHYWIQNTRLVYWPMLASGDYDLLMPYFKMYRDMLSLCKARTKVYTGHRGAFYPECTTFYGGVYGYFNPADKGKSTVFPGGPFVHLHWNGQLDILAMMLDYYRQTGDAALLKETILPMADEVFLFYDEQFTRDKNGKLYMHPSQSLETWWETINPLPDIAGLRWDMGQLLALPDSLLGATRRKTWQKLFAELPAIPIGENSPTLRAIKEKAKTLAELDAHPITPEDRKDAIRMLLPAEQFANYGNCETPELYAVFPFRFYGAGKPDLTLARTTMAQRRITGWEFCWNQDPIDFACLGQAPEAQAKVEERFFNPSYRFPVFYRTSQDWSPDEDHAGVAMTALQYMLLQTDGDKILLFPAWPKEWNVDFKLHAPCRTIIEGSYRDGKLLQLKVTPPSRAKDVIKFAPQ